jgi:hypothetical protein
MEGQVLMGMVVGHSQHFLPLRKIPDPAGGQRKLQPRQAITFKVVMEGDPSKTFNVEAPNLTMYFDDDADLVTVARAQKGIEVAQNAAPIGSVVRFEKKRVRKRNRFFFKEVLKPA